MPATREECRTRLIQLQSDLAAIRDQIAVADLDRQARGGQMDTGWYRRARTALRFKREEMVRLQAHQRTLPGGPAERKARLRECIIATVRPDYNDDEWRTVMDAAHRLLLIQGGV
ncbi:MAG: hypothetical protein HQL73_10500 [Magnetococcales bacterium]|nr:hypothetical protein [Magnetococcales bacterium]